MCRCPNTNTTDCIQSPFEAIGAINNVSTPSDGSGWTKTAAGCDVFDKSQSGFAAALALAEEADYVVVGLGISDCGPDSPIDSGTCYKHSSTAQYEYPDGFMEMEAHDRTSIDLPPTQQAFAKAVLALGKPTVVFMLNAGAVSIDDIASHAASASAPLAIIEAFYPGLRGAQALAEGIFGDMNACSANAVWAGPPAALRLERGRLRPGLARGRRKPWHSAHVRVQARIKYRLVSTRSSCGTAAQSSTARPCRRVGWGTATPCTALLWPWASNE